MIKVFTKDTCPWCDKTKEYLKSKNVEFEELNVMDDMEAREEMIKLTRQMKVPVIKIDDNIIIGFDEEKLEEALSEKN